MITIKQKIGREEIQVSGGIREAEAFLARWQRAASLRADETFAQMSKRIRQVSEELGVAGAQDRAILELLEELLVRMYDTRHVRNQQGEGESGDGKRTD